MASYDPAAHPTAHSHAAHPTAHSHAEHPTAHSHAAHPTAHSHAEHPTARSHAADPTAHSHAEHSTAHSHAANPTAHSHAAHGRTVYGQTTHVHTVYDQTGHVQTVYEVTSITDGATSTRKEEEEEDKRSFAASATMVCATIIICILISVLIAFFTVGFGYSYVTEATETPFPNVIYRGGGVKVVVVTKATPVATTEETETPVASTAAPSQMMDDQPLVCTVGRRLNSTRMFPPDGLCEYIFFDSLYKQGRNSIVAPEGFDTNLRTFIDVAPLHEITAFGVGITFDSVHHLELLLNSSAPSFKPMEIFWDNAIYHLAILDTATVSPVEHEVISALGCLKMNQGRKIFTVFAASIPDDAWANLYIRNFTTLFKPDLFIGFGHYTRGDNSLKSCRIVPPTLFQRPPGAEYSYQHDMTAGFETFKKLSVPGLALKFALSVTLKGRLTVSTVPNMYDFFTPCLTNETADSFATYAEVCKNPGFKTAPIYDSQVDATRILHAVKPEVFSYDDRVGLCKKLCTMKAQDTSMKFGIAVYDLDYADFSNTCGSKDGPFSRLHLVRNILNFFRTRYRTTADTADCVNLAT
ncbi:uncharacterized protein [Dermacentor albipictus]|uniref:uncharacterized protein isoform X2 n=1 Tax=Dermacentor albipictus TaxID=60249 RepID=UPI0038FCAD16